MENVYLKSLIEALENYEDNIATVDQGKRVSYKELFELIKKGINYFSKNLDKGSLVPIMLKSGYEYVAVEIALWLSNNVAIPMGDTFPKDRVDYILSETNAKLVVDDKIVEAIKKEDTNVKINYPNPNDLALIMYTSGSTGNPKGIMHNYIGLDKKEKFSYKEDDAYLFLSPFYFIASLTIFKVLKGGGSVHFISNEDKLDIHKIEDYVLNNKITHMFLPPSALRNFKNKSDLLKVVYVGSERVSNLKSEGSYKLINCYGMTETLGTVCSFEINKDYDQAPVGKTMYEYKLVDDDGNEVKKGSIGEFLIKGNFTLGYYNDKEKTEKLYTKDGYLKTNDLLRELPDGNLVYVNRKDWMVKINGQRVEIGEVESRIKSLDGISDAIVKGFENKDGNTYLCAFYIGDLEQSAIKDALIKLLPSYMVPNYYVKTAKFQLLPNGKVNRKVLLAPDLNNMNNNDDYIAPTNKLEERICNAFKEVFGLDRCGINDDFFLYGGDSIRVMKLSLLLEDLNISSKIIYKERTPKNIAFAIKNEAKEHHDVNKAPLSYTELGIYTECKMNKGKAIYNNPILFKLGNNVDINKLKDSIIKAVSDHKNIMVNVYEDDDMNPYMELNNKEFNLEIENISNKELEEIKKDLVKPFILDTDMLFRIRLFKTEDSIYLFLDFHHIIFDGTSMKIFMDDINNIYLNNTNNPEKYTLFDIAINEAKDREDASFNDAKNWYLDTFKKIDLDSKPIKDLDLEEVKYNSFERKLNINASELDEYSKRINLTLNVVTLGAFSYLLSIYKNQREALFTTIYNGRNNPITNNTIAMMVKTLPVYARYDEKTKIVDYLNDIKNLELDCMNNDIYSFLELARDTGINSDVLFAYQGDYLAIGDICGKQFERIPLEFLATGSSLNFQVFKNDNDLIIKVEYKSNEYSNTFINHMISSFEAIIKGFMIEEKVIDVSILNEEDIKLLDSFNDNDIDSNYSLTIPKLFDDTAAKYAANIAVLFNDLKLTYNELNELANGLAKMILDKNIKHGDVASILIPRSLLMPVCGLGVQKCGVTYQPLDPTYPKDRLEFMIKDSNAKILITTDELRPLISNYDGEVLIINSLDDINKSKININDSKPEDTMILLYTSGSTGIPKGVRLTEKNLCAFIGWYHRFYKLDSNSIVGAYASFGFDANMMDMYPALTSGATLSILPEEYRLDLTKLDEYFTNHKVSHLFLTTQVGRQYGIDGTNPYLKYLSMGGEKLIAYPINDKYKTYNLYGPTEGTVLATAHEVKKGETNIPIGKMIDNYKGYVVGIDGKRLPIGAIGELYIAGPQVALGYLNRDDITNKVFIKNPFDDNKKYQNCYRTGDIVRFMENGEIEFVGRQDGQVKIRGFRVELSEIEEVIRRYNGIKDCALKAFDHKSGGKYICAYLVCDKDFDLEGLKKFILDVKPPYMVPQNFVFLDKIPLNQNGKVNKKELKEPEYEIKEETNKVLNALEEKLKAIVLNILELEDCSITQSLYEYGLTSILAIKLLTTIYKEFNIDISIKDLANDMSIVNIENHIIDNLLNNKSVKKEEDINYDSSALSYAQTGVYFECVKKPNDLTYNIPSLFTFNKNIDVNKLKKCLNKIISNHKEINIHFVDENAEIKQIYNDYEIEIKENEIDNDDISIYKDSFVKPFDLLNGPLARFEILKAKSNVYLFLDFHHLVFDGASMDIFINELRALLNDNEIEKESYSYFNFVYDQKNNENSNEYKERLEYFNNIFSDFESSTEITPDLNLGGNDLGLSSIEFDFDKVNNFCKANNLTPAQLILASVYYTTARYVNDKNVYLSTISNGRANNKLNNVFGMFVNTIPLNIKLASMSVMDFIKLSQKSFNDAINNEEFPFAKINELYHFNPSIVYEYQLGVINKIDIDNLIGYESLMDLKAKFKLAIHVEKYNNKPSIVSYYNKGLYTEDLIYNYTKSILICLNKMIDNPNENVLHIDLLDKERKEELDRFSYVGGGKLSYSLYHEGLEIMAKKYPDKLGLVAIDEKYTYKEFNEMANRLAHTISKMGIRDSNIIILLPRTSRLLISIFGVLKSGNAYIPCDPNYPKERINLIMEDSEAKLIITTKDMLDSFENTIDVEKLLLNDEINNLDLDINPDSLAYLIYTSGSTGKPKGVMLRHIGVANYCQNVDANIYAKEVSKLNAFLAVTTISFDMSVKEIGVALTNGITVVLAGDCDTNNPEALAKIIIDNKIDGLNATPSRLKEYLDVKAFRDAVGTLKFIASGGEKYPYSLLEELRTITKAHIMNTYGPTEITVSCNFMDLTNSNKIRVGRPIYNTYEYIVDSDGNLLPRGVVGELYIGGIGVAKGYHNLEEKTKESFIKYMGMDVYKSGDYARWDLDGFVEILGRKDNQIKLRGLRIELGEIETALQSVEYINQSVIKIMNISNQDHLCAYFTASKKVDINELKEELSKTLTKYMIPTAYLQLPKMPLTPNGKIDMKNLPEPELLDLSSHEEAKNEVEQRFIDIFKEILNTSDVGATDSFFDIGGTSLSAIRITVMAAKYDYKLTYPDVFANPTPRKLAALFITEKQDDSYDSEIMDYDYKKINDLLANNNIDSYKNNESLKLGNVLLTGPIGYLGIHILKEYLDNYDGRVYCLLRGKGDSDPLERLRGQLYYYFETDYYNLYNKRIFVIDSDITKDLNIKEEYIKDIDTIINCAAVVKHFSVGSEIEDVNVGGVKNLLKFAEKHNIKFIQVSTASVVKAPLLEDKPNVITANENMLYINQMLNNKYVRSKFLAEREILEAVSNGKVVGKIMRVGNLSPRVTDGEFQINSNTNSAMGRLKSFNMLGVIPYSSLNQTLEFSPIDNVACAILKLIETPKECVLFHPVNYHQVSFSDIIKSMNESGLNVKPVENDEFVNVLVEAEKDPEKAEILTSMLAYKGNIKAPKMPKAGNNYTMQVLFRKGFDFSQTDNDYIKGFLNALIGLAFFEL